MGTAGREDAKGREERENGNSEGEDELKKGGRRNEEGQPQVWGSDQVGVRLRRRSTSSWAETRRAMSCAR
jgi:hypothetical protein